MQVCRFREEISFNVDHSHSWGGQFWRSLLQIFNLRASVLLHVNVLIDRLMCVHIEFLLGSAIAERGRKGKEQGNCFTR